MNHTMTEGDEALISLLRVNARLPVSELARRLGVSRTTVQDRLKRLENNGIIAGYSVRLGEMETERLISAFVTIVVTPQRGPAVLTVLGKISNLESLYSVSGKYDLIAIVRTRSAAAMEKVLDEIAMLDGVERTETSIILSKKLDRNKLA